MLLDTWRGLTRPHRLWPITLVSTSLIFTEVWFSRSWMGFVEAVAMVAVFLMLGPFSWRALLGQQTTWAPQRLLLFGLLSTVLPLLSWLRLQLGFGVHTFLTTGVNNLVIVSLCWAGAWGLGRDIEMEQGLQQAKQRAEQLARAAEHAQLMAIRTHLDPHFLFNTLNAIAEWCREDGAVAENAILKLSALLREVMAGVQSSHWALSRELQLVEDLWALHQVRDPERFHVLIERPDVLPAAFVPPMLLLPLAENAVKHGPGMGHRGPLRMQVHPLPDRKMCIRISNPGPFSGPRSGGEGLAMVHKRMTISYGEHGHFSIVEDNERTVATLILPLSMETTP